MKLYKLERTIKDEEETIININEITKQLEITTHTPRIFKSLLKKLGEPIETYKPVVPHKDDKFIYISGATWKYNFFDNREEIKKILSITNLIPRKKTL